MVVLLASSHHNFKRSFDSSSNVDKIKRIVNLTREDGSQQKTTSQFTIRKQENQVESDKSFINLWLDNQEYHRRHTIKPSLLMMNDRMFVPRLCLKWQSNVNFRNCTVGLIKDN
jgi:hypothetical protein